MSSSFIYVGMGLGGEILVKDGGGGLLGSDCVVGAERGD